ncbi:TIR-like protein FxsC [Actinoplanes sp. NPDC048796]|uniref:TIR-like protein FxsC n=1 Tax=unclassified Actinoplanes TaxID=2626549 RepID=UPI0033D55ACC
MGSSVAPPFFFISYAHDPGEDNYHVDRFYRDLNHDVLMFAGSRAETAGFCDALLKLGQRWSESLVDNLSTAQVFIPIMSPGYFRSPACGKEWAVFSARLARGARPGSESALIIPLLWVPMTPPPIAQPYQFKDRDLGATYDEVKLRALIREGRYADDYKAFVQKLAQRVFELGETAPLAPEPGRPSFDDIASAFPTVPEARTPNGGRDVKAPAGNRRSSRVDRPILNTNLPEDPR